MALAVACAPPPCAPGDRPTLRDPDGAARPGLLEEIAAGVERFATWSDSVPCVREIRVVPGLTAGGVPAEGQVAPRSGHLEVDAQAPDGARTTLHELCHAWDAAAGRPSQGAFASLAPDVPAHPAYPDPVARQREAFARACAVGPVDPAVGRAAPGCGPDPALADALRAAVWTAAPPAWSARVEPAAPRADLALAPLLGGGRVVAAAPCGASACLVVADAGPPLVPPTAYDALGQALVVVDLEAGRVAVARPMPRREESGWSLLGGPAGALLVESTAGGRAWWVTPAGDITPREAPPVGHGEAVEGTAAAEVAWVADAAGVRPYDLIAGAWGAPVDGAAAPPWPGSAATAAVPAPGALGLSISWAGDLRELPVGGLSAPVAAEEAGLRAWAPGLGVARLDPDARVLTLPSATCGPPAGPPHVGAPRPWRLARDPDRLVFAAAPPADRSAPERPAPP